ncbi:hypothetical protein [Jeotgalibacillus soli]|uniref:Uncharacterized protein n=1 Tax=Jeotgalibacillus soli TaxID=889306 RepID=A0A0C2VMV1_9BACL|nr:hypothetical protein [Jeotgalibacillus soli]KIL45771.1 hypothetical protein KP78_21200 [Jeotgalibacillus soli]
MKKHNELKSILQEPKYYLDYKQKDLERRLDEIALSPETEKQIRNEHTKEVAKSKALSLLGTFGEVITTFLEWNDGVNKDITEAKKSLLLAHYMDKVDDHRLSIDKLKEFLVNPQGNTLFNKILRILDDSPPDGDLIEHLSSALKFIINNESFSKLFDIHKFSLSQIERLSPQALSVLSDYKNFPIFKKFEMVQEGNKVKEEYHHELAKAYCHTKGIKEELIINRVGYSFFELKRAGFIDAKRLNGDGAVEVFLTTPGKEITQYLTIKERH